MEFKFDLRIGKDAGKPWPEECAWPEPLYDGCGPEWDVDDAILLPLDEEGEELIEIREYFDELVEKGVLDRKYELVDDDLYDLEEFFPEKGEEYWIDDGFDVELWEDDLSEHMNLLKLDIYSEHCLTVSEVQQAIGYEFINENLMRQAFTRRAFAIEHALSGCNEELEFIGDEVLSMSVTHDMEEQLSKVDVNETEAPFVIKYDEGQLTKIRTAYVSKEYLAGRASELGLDQYILYGTGEEHTESSREDMIEALIGAVAVDSGWDDNVIRGVVDKLIQVQLSESDTLVKKTYYEIFNSWHQKHFGCIPEYEMSGMGPYHCSMKYMIPENDKGIWTSQRVDVERETRGAAREFAAELAYRFVQSHGLWINLKDARIIPDPENSINQLQELSQKGYLNNRPEYKFDLLKAPVFQEADMTEEEQELIEDEPDSDIWKCTLTVDGTTTTAYATSKTRAKKTAAYKYIKYILS